MTWFSLPVTQVTNKAAFFDADSALTWLSGQPQANAPVMHAELARQIQALNGFRLPPQVRFKTLEALRKTIFAVDGECQRRFENRPLPLSEAEQSALDTSRRLWHACAVAYLHCVRACLDGDQAALELKVTATHRAMACLRMEQMSAYLGGAEMAPENWRNLHAVLASAEQLGVARVLVSDRRLAETRESTVCGQYAMTLLLHLVRPFELSRGQFAAATRWLARWREQAEVLIEPDPDPKARSIALDLTQDSPIHTANGTPGIGRWLATGDVLRKMRKRIESLAAGETPENLKLGSGLSVEACSALLSALADSIRHPQAAAAGVPVNAPVAEVVGGLEAIHRQLGGKSLKAEALSSTSNRRNHEQIAIFGHVREDPNESDKVRPEEWRVVEEKPTVFKLNRAAATGVARLANRNLIAVRLPDHPHYALATLSCLYSRCDGSLYAVARRLPGEAVPSIVEVRERGTGKTSRQPVFLLPAVGPLGRPASLVLPAGLSARAQSLILQQENTLSIRLCACLERGSDYECWSYEPGKQV